MEKRRQDGDTTPGGSSTSGTSISALNWRALPDGPLGRIAELMGPRVCNKLSEAQAIRAVLPRALVTLKVDFTRHSRSPRQLAWALVADSDAEAVPGSVSARVTQALATQQACSEIALIGVNHHSVAAAVGEALKANNECWKELTLSKLPEARTLAVLLEGLQHNHVLEKLYIGAGLSVDCGVAIGNALRAPDTWLRELRCHGSIDDARSVQYLVEGVKRNRTLRRLELGFTCSRALPDLSASMEVLGDVLREQQVPLEALVLDSGVSFRPFFGPGNGALFAEGLARNSKLQELTLSAYSFHHALCNALGTALAFEDSALRKLCICIHGNMDDDAGATLAAGLKHNKALQQLKLAPCTIGIATCRALGSALASDRLALCKLDLSWNKYVNDAAGTALVEGLACNSTLRCLKLSNCCVGFGTCRALGAALAFDGSALCELDLSDGKNVDDAAGAALVEGLASNSTLHRLNLSRCGVGIETCCVLGAALAFEGSNLCELDLDNNRNVDDAAGAALVEGLASNSKLGRLNLSRCSISTATCRGLGLALASESTALYELDPSGNKNIGDAGGAALAEGLASNSTLRCLKLNLCGVALATCSALGLAVAFESTALCELDLRYNRDVIDAAGAALAEGLASNSTLRHLNLGGCDVGIATCCALGSALAYERSALHELSLNGDKNVDDAAGAAVAEGLASNSTLRRLILSDCRVALATCSALGLALAFEGSALRELDLDNNNTVDDAAGAALAEGLASNNTLCRLVLFRSNVGKAMQRHINKLLSKAY